MPIDPTRPASDYTMYVRERADIIKRGYLDFSSSLFKSAVFASSFAPPERPPEEYGILTGFGEPYLLYRGLNPGTSNFTVECFFKANDVTSERYIWAFDESGPWIGLGVENDELFLEGDVSGYLGSVEPNTWYFAAITRSGNNWYGTLNNTTVLLTEYTFNLSGLDLSIGGDYYDESLETPFSGSISNFRYVKRALYSPGTTTIPDRPLQDIEDTELLLIATQNAKFADTSGNNRVATGILPEWSPGPSESYGILDFVVIRHLVYPDFPVEGDFTVELFFKTSNPNGSSISNLWMIENNDDVGMRITDGNLQLRRSPGFEPIIIESPEANRWYHVAVTRNAGTWYTFADGVMQEIDDEYIDLSNGFLAIGDDSINSSNPFYDGSITNFRVSNYARYTTDFTVPTPPLSSQGARLLLLAKENAPFADSSGNNLVAEGTCDWIAGPILYPPPPPFLDYGILTRFDSDEVLYYPSFQPPPTNFTIELFFKSTNVNYLFQNLFSIGDGFNAIRLYIVQSKLTIWYSGTNDTTAPTLSNNQWYHIAVTRSGSSWYFSINGTTTFRLDTTISILPGLTIGGYDGGSDPFYNGSITNLRISNYARYTAGYTVPTLPMEPSDTDLLLLLAKPNLQFIDSVKPPRQSNETIKIPGWGRGPIDYTPP